MVFFHYNPSSFISIKLVIKFKYYTLFLYLFRLYSIDDEISAHIHNTLTVKNVLELI